MKKVLKIKKDSILYWTGYNKNIGLKLSAESGDVKITKLLLDNGANVHFSNEWALRLSCMYGHKEVIKLLLEYGADINAICMDDLELEPSIKRYIYKKLKLI